MKMKISGDITASYCILNDKDAKEMSDILPNGIKLIFVMRNPIDRAWSHFKMQMRTSRKFEVQDYEIEEIKDFLTLSGQVARTDYIAAIERYRKFFPNSPIFITFYDFLKENPKGFLDNIVKYLGGDVENIKEINRINKRIHESINAKMPIEIKIFLQKYYFELIQNLSFKYGGYCTNWLYETDPSTNKNLKDEKRPYIILEPKNS